MRPKKHAKNVSASKGPPLDFSDLQSIEKYPLAETTKY
jgi:hypothetical protein